MKKALFSLCLIASSSMPVLSVIACNNNSELDKANANIAALKVEDITTKPTKKNNVNYGRAPIADNLVPPAHSGFAFEFKSATLVNEEGEATIIYTVKVDPLVVDSKSSDMSFQVSGFQTKAAADKIQAIATANANIDALKVEDITTKPIKKNNVNYGRAPIADNLVPPAHSGFAFEFKSATLVNEEGEATIIYTVKVDPLVVDSKSSDMSFQVSGFENKAAADKVKAITTANTSIDALKVEDITTKPIKKNNVNYEKAPIADNLAPPAHSGFTFEFKSATPVNVDGETTTIYTVKVDPLVVDSKSRDMSFQVSGFQTKVAADKIATANTSIDALKVEDITTKPTKKNNVNYEKAPTADNLAPPAHSGFTFEFKSATPVNADGETTIIYTIKVDPLVVDSKSRDMSFQVSGFQTKVAADKIATANTSIDALKVENITTKPTKKNNVNYEKAPTADDLAPPAHSGFTFEFKSATPVNADGETIIIYTIKVDPLVVDSKSSDMSFQVSGFQTKVAADKIATANTSIDALKVENITTKPTKKNNVNYEKAPTADDLVPPAHSGFTFEFKSATPVNVDGETTIIYTVKVDPLVVDSKSRDMSFQVSGFETKAAALSKANARIQALGSKDFPLSTSAYPSKKNLVKQNVIPTSSDVNPPVKKGFSFTFKSATSVDSVKSSKVTYTVDVEPAISGTTTKDIVFVVGYFF